MIPARCKPDDHKRVWSAEYWVCDTCLICGSEPDKAKRGTTSAAKYSALMKQKNERDSKVAMVR